MYSTYQLIVNGTTMFEGNVFKIALIALIIFVILFAIGITLWRKIRENEVLKYEFITIIAHKFRTPLTHLKWITEDMAQNATDASARENLSDIGQSTDKLIALTGSLIELTNANKENKSAYKFEPASICQLARDVVTAFQKPYREKNISVSVQCVTPDIMANIDKPRIEFVLQTLLENSYTYTPPGRKVEVTVYSESNKAIIAVADNGIGIAPADMPKIFTKFYRAKNAQEADTEGFGIGLFMAQTIANRHKGKIEASSPGRDQGSIFKIVLPLVH